MLRYMQGVWDSFFPTVPVYPLQVVGCSDHVVESAAELEAQLKNRFLLFTYRAGFEGIASVTSAITSDQGWGCLLRTSQMLLAHFLWVYSAPEDRKLSFFFDSSSDTAPFSIHSMIRHVWNRRAFKAEYWSPSQGCEALRSTMTAAVAAKMVQTRVAVVTSSNSCIYSSEVFAALRGGAQVVLVLAAVRVSAVPQLTQESYLQLEGLLQLPQCLGMVGGVPGRSYYFFAHNQTQLFYLDPHQQVLPALTSGSSGAYETVQPTLADVRCVHWSRVDTSLFVAFAITGSVEWRQMQKKLCTKFLHVEDQRVHPTYLTTQRRRRPPRVKAPMDFISPLQNTEPLQQEPARTMGVMTTSSVNVCNDEGDCCSGCRDGVASSEESWEIMQ